MTFTLDPAGMADLLEDRLGQRPNITADGNRLVVADPFPLRLTIAPSNVPHHFDVRCSVGLDPVAPGMAFMAANAVNYSGDHNARIIVFVADDGDVTILGDAMVAGPINPGLEFAVALRNVFEVIVAFDRQLTQVRSMFEAVQSVGDAADSPAPVTDIASARRPAPAAGPVAAPQAGAVPQAGYL